MLFSNTAIKLTVLWLGIVFVLMPSMPDFAYAQDSDQAKALQIGILPTLSARALIKNYQPLQTYLERKLNRPIDLLTAPDFKTFHYDTVDGKFDIVITAAHLARIAQTDAKYIPLATYKAVNQTILLEAKDNPLKTIADLKGKSISFGDRNALIVSQTIGYLSTQGLREGEDYKLLETQSHNSAAYSVQNHQSMLAITSPSGLKNIPDAIKDSVKIFATLPQLPSLILLAHPRVGTDAALLKAALIGFTSDTDEGRQFYEVTNYIGLREVTNGEMKDLETYARDIRNTLKKTK
jgi:phosphonate transport system substrate-binding protein